MTNQPSSVDLHVVMDPLASVVPSKDSSHAMMLEAHRRAWLIWVAQLSDMWIRDGRAWGRLTELQVIDEPDDWYRVVGELVCAPDDMNIVLMRKDPPFDMEYVYATYALERAWASRIRWRAGAVPCRGGADGPDQNSPGPPSDASSGVIHVVCRERAGQRP